MSRTERKGNDAPVVHLTTVHHPRDPRISYKQLPTLQDAGFDVTLVASGGAEEMPSAFPTVALPPAKGRLQRLPLLWTAYRRARSIGAALYHIHDPELIPVGFLLKRQTGAAVIYDMHEDYGGRGGVEGAVLRSLERWCFAWVDHVVTAERHYAPIVPSTVPYTFVGNYYKPYEEGTAPSTPPGDLPPWTLLYTGSIAGDRGLFTMLALADRFQKEDMAGTIRLVGICRQADQRRRAERQIRARGLEGALERVGWTTYVPAADMPPHYRQADVGVSFLKPTPDHVKSLPTKFFEYLHFGLPIICTDIPLWRSFIETHECGAVVPWGDVEAIMEVLKRWGRHPELYREYARNARAAAPDYRWAEMGDRLVRAYRRVLFRKTHS